MKGSYRCYGGRGPTGLRLPRTPRSGAPPFSRGNTVSAETSVSVNTVLPGLRHDRERPVHARCELPCDREAEPGARRLAARGAVEALKHVLHAGRRGSRAPRRGPRASRGRRRSPCAPRPVCPRACGAGRSRPGSARPGARGRDRRSRRPAPVLTSSSGCSLTSARTRNSSMTVLAASVRSTSRFTNLIWPASSRDRSSRSVASRVRRVTCARVSSRNSFGARRRRAPRRPSARGSRRARRAASATRATRWR